MTDADFKWSDDLGIGYYPVHLHDQYGPSYWERYESYRKSAIADSLMYQRVMLVEKYVPREEVVDIGIGTGHFITTRGAWLCLDANNKLTYGYDVNPAGVKWLLERGIWFDPYFKHPANVTMWDSLEHMQHPDDLIRRVDKTVFISIPIFRDMPHALSSKHYKPDEHFWYFTRSGLLRWMNERGFSLLEENDMETKLGREDIGTFVFKRV